MEQEKLRSGSDLLRKMKQKRRKSIASIGSKSSENSLAQQTFHSSSINSQDIPNDNSSRPVSTFNLHGAGSEGSPDHASSTTTANETSSNNGSNGSGSVSSANNQDTALIMETTGEEHLNNNNGEMGVSPLSPSTSATAMVLSKQTGSALSENIIESIIEEAAYSVTDQVITESTPSSVSPTPATPSVAVVSSAPESYSPHTVSVAKADAPSSSTANPSATVVSSAPKSDIPHETASGSISKSDVSPSTTTSPAVAVVSDKIKTTSTADVEQKHIPERKNSTGSSTKKEGKPPINTKTIKISEDEKKKKKQGNNEDPIDYLLEHHRRDSQYYEELRHENEELSRRLQKLESQNQEAMEMLKKLDMTRISNENGNTGIKDDEKNKEERRLECENQKEIEEKNRIINEFKKRIEELESKPGVTDDLVRENKQLKEMLSDSQSKLSQMTQAVKKDISTEEDNYWKSRYTQSCIKVTELLQQRRILQQQLNESNQQAQLLPPQPSNNRQQSHHTSGKIPNDCEKCLKYRVKLETLLEYCEKLEKKNRYLLSAIAKLSTQKIPLVIYE